MNLYSGLKYSRHPTPWTDAEKRSEARLRALADLRHLYGIMSSRFATPEQQHDMGLLSRSIKILEENT